MAELAARKAAKATTATGPSQTGPARKDRTHGRPRPQPKPSQITVTKNDTFASLARTYNLAEPDLIKSAGFDRLVAGQVISLPTTPIGPQRETGAMGVRGAEPAKPGYANQGQGFAQFREQEVQSVNDTQAIADWEKLKAGGIFPQSPEAVRIRKNYNAFLERNPNYFDGPPSQAPAPPPVGQEVVKAVGNLKDWARGQYDYAKWYVGGGEEGRYNPETGLKEGGSEYIPLDRLERQARKAEEMDKYYSSMLESLTEQQITQVTSEIKPQTGEPLATEDYPVYEGSTTYSDGENVYYAKDGRVIPVSEFEAYLEVNNRHYDNLEGYLNSPEGQKQVFVQGTKKALEGIYFGMLEDNRDYFPDYLTPAQLEMYDPNRDWDDYMRNVLNYRWDAESGAWIKQDEDGSIPLLGGGSGGSGGGYGGGYASGGDWSPGTSQYLRGGEGSHLRRDRRFEQPVGGIAPTHWRI